MRLIFRDEILPLVIGFFTGVIATVWYDNGCKFADATREPEPIVVLCETNAVETTLNEFNQVETNITDRAGNNYQWFTDSNNFIWDGWKIK